MRNPSLLRSTPTPTTIAVFYYAIPEAEALLSGYLFPLFLLFAYLLPPLAWALRRRHA